MQRLQNKEEDIKESDENTSKKFDSLMGPANETAKFADVTQENLKQIALVRRPSAKNEIELKN